MPYRFVVTKSSAQGEQITAEIAQFNQITGEIVHEEKDMHRLLDATVAHLDLRMEDMNVRMLEAYGLDNHFDLPTWQKVISILDILAGRQSAQQVVQRWEAAIEETRELERDREAARVGSLNGDSDASFTE